MTTIGSSSGSAPATAPALADAAAVAPADRRRRARPKRQWSAGQIVLRALLIGFALLFLYPLVWLLAASLKPASQVFDNSLIPQTWRFDNYAKVWDELPLVHWMFNSIAIALLAAAAVSISSSIVAFGFAYFRFPGRNILFGLVLATMMLPASVTMIPTYLIWKESGFLGTWVPLFGVNLFGSAFYIFLQRQFYLGLPRELFEAARMDGATYWGLFWRIAMPLSLPSFIIVFLFEFQAAWNNFQGALIYLNGGSVQSFTAPLGIAYAMTKYSPTAGGQGDYQYVMVASLLVTLPMLLLFSIGQRYFIEGVATQGRKG